VPADGPQQTTALTGAGAVGMSIESAFTYSSYTWLHVLSRSTNKETIWEMPTKWPRLPGRSIPMKVSLAKSIELD